MPTYGVSFGLPYPSGAYPPNVHGDYYPAQNPYFGSIGPNGLNLGLLNVNPLLSVQVSKTEYGDKVVKPLVNLHVTPNANILQKVGDLFKRKPAKIYSTHYHQHDHFSGFEHGIEHGIEHDHHEHHEHHPHFITSHVPIKHYSIEMIPSKEIFEYHSGPSIPPLSPPIHHHEHHENHESFGHTSFAEHHTTGAQHYYPETTGPNYSTHTGFGHTSVGHIDGSSGYGTTGNLGNYGAPSGFGNNFYDRSANVSSTAGYTDNTSPADVDNGIQQENYAEASGSRRGKQLALGGFIRPIPTQAPGAAEGSAYITFPRDRRRRSVVEHEETTETKGSVFARSVKPEQVTFCNQTTTTCGFNAA